MQAVQAFVAVVLVSSGVLCSHSPRPAQDGVQPFVAGGVARENGDLKFIVEIMEKVLFVTYHSGSGVLISAKHVLTTTYVVDSRLGKFHVVIGRSAGGQGTSIDIDEKIKEPNEGILTLLKLKTPVSFDSLNRPANLPSPNSNTAGVSAILSGFGPTTSDKKNTKLTASTVSVLPSSQCQTSYGVAAGRLCSMDPRVGACDGDDGSPLVQDLKNGVFRLLGIVTATKGVSCPPKGATVYVDVAKHTTWILDSIYSS